MSKELLTKSRNFTFCQKYWCTNRVIALLSKLLRREGHNFNFRQNDRFSNFVITTIVLSRASTISWPQLVSKVVLNKSRNSNCHPKYCFEHLVGGIYMHSVATNISQPQLITNRLLQIYRMPNRNPKHCIRNE